MTLILYAVGDIMLGEQPLCYRFGVKSIIEQKGFDYLFSDFKKIFKDADIVFGNLETPVSNQSPHEDIEKFFFLANTDVIKGLKETRFNVLSIANNHILDHESDGFFSTISSLKESNIVPIGLKNAIEILPMKNLKIAFLAYSFIEDNKSNLYYNKISSANSIIQDILNIRKTVDIIVVALHWGDEYVPFPSPHQVSIGRELIDHGADVILGCHAHVPQGYEIYKSKPIVYGLGNFVFDHTYIDSTRKSFFVKLEINDAKEINIYEIPINSEKSFYRPKPIKNSSNSSQEIFFANNKIKMKNYAISNYSLNESDYEILRKQYKKRAKFQMVTHFISNLYRYPPQLIAYFIKCRLSR